MKTAHQHRPFVAKALRPFAICCFAAAFTIPCHYVHAVQEGTKTVPPVTEHGSTKSDETTSTQIEPRKLFDGKSIDGWEVIGFGGQDDIKVLEGAIVAEAGYPLAGIASNLKDLPKSNYTLALEAQKIDGTDFFCCITFPVKEQHCSLVVGGWGGTLCGISCINGDDASHNATRWLKKFEKGQWYAIEIKVTDDRIVCSIDKELAIDLPLDGIELTLRSEVIPTTPIGICAFETKSAWRNIRLTPIEPNPESKK